MRTKTLILALMACLLAGVASAQFFRGGREAPDPRGAPPEAEFHMARLAYATRGGCAGSRGFCNPWWAIDYPLAEAHFLPAVERMTNIEVAPDSRHITVDDEYLFDYPWLFLQQPGRGYWMPEAIALCRAHGVQIDPFYRPVHAPRGWQRGLRRVLARRYSLRALRARKSGVIDLR